MRQEVVIQDFVRLSYASCDSYISVVTLGSTNSNQREEEKESRSFDEN